LFNSFVTIFVAEEMSGIQ